MFFNSGVAEGAMEDNVKISFGGPGWMAHNLKARLCLKYLLPVLYQKDHCIPNGGRSMNQKQLSSDLNVIKTVSAGWKERFFTCLLAKKGIDSYKFSKLIFVHPYLPIVGMILKIWRKPVEMFYPQRCIQAFWKTIFLSSGNPKIGIST